MKLAFLGYRLSGVRSGAHLTHLETARGLAERNHDVRYAALLGERLTRFDDPIEVGAAKVEKAASWADVVFIRDEPKVKEMFPYCRRSVVYVVHSPAGDPAVRSFHPGPSWVVVWVSPVLARPLPTPSVLIEGCPIDPSWVRTTPGDHVTLVNLSQRKGGPLFWELAERMPDVQFLGVRGWGEQYLPQRLPKNVGIMEPVADPRLFYSRTRVLLLPSADPGTVLEPRTQLPQWGEAWNRVGVEACISGIPVLAHPAAGVKASLGGAGLYADRDAPECWEAELRQLLGDPQRWQLQSDRALERGRHVELDRERILDEYEAIL